MKRVFLACLMVFVTVSAARADVFVIAPHWFPKGTDGERVGDEIVRAIQEDLASEHRVLAPLEVARLVEREERVWCDGGACAERYREAAGAVATIFIIVGRSGAGAGPSTSFQIGIQPAPGLEYIVGALLSDGPLQEIAVKTFREAFRRYRQGPGPWLEVVGGPKGAEVFVDDRSVGLLPLTIAVQTGGHLVRVQKKGFAPVMRTIRFDSPTDRARLEFYLEPERIELASAADQLAASEKGPPASPRRDKRPMRFVWAGSGLLVGGIGLVAAPLVAMASADCTQRGPDGACVSEEDGLPQSAAVSLFVVGGVAATAGAVLLGRGLWRRRRASLDVQVGWGIVTLKGAY